MIFLYILQGLLLTLVITFSSFLIGSLLGVVVVAGKSSALRIVRTFTQVWIEIIRSVPPLVWLFLVYFGLAEVGLRLQPLQAAILTFSLIASVYLGEIYRGGFAALSRGQIEAASAIGLGRFDILTKIISPQVFRTVSPSMVTYLIGLMKDSALASTIGVAEMTFRANQITQTTGQGLFAFGIVGVIYLVISAPIGYWARNLDTRMRAKYQVS